MAPSWTRAKMAKKWPKNGKTMEKLHYFSIFGPFFAIFAPVQLGAVFHFDSHFFSISGFLAVFHAIPARQDPNSAAEIARFFRLALRQKIATTRDFRGHPRNRRKPAATMAAAVRFCGFSDHGSLRSWVSLYMFLDVHKFANAAAVRKACRRYGSYILQRQLSSASYMLQTPAKLPPLSCYILRKRCRTRSLFSALSLAPSLDDTFQSAFVLESSLWGLVWMSSEWILPFLLIRLFFLSFNFFACFFPFFPLL